MTGNNLKLDLVNVDGIQNLVRFCQFALEILSGNKILTLIKGRNSVQISQKMMGSNPKLGFVNVDVYTKFGQSIHIKIECGNQIFTESRKDGMTEGQSESSIAPLFQSGDIINEGPSTRL